MNIVIQLFALALLGTFVTLTIIGIVMLVRWLYKDIKNGRL